MTSFAFVYQALTILPVLFLHKSIYRGNGLNDSATTTSHVTTDHDFQSSKKQESSCQNDQESELDETRGSIVIIENRMAKSSQMFGGLLD